MAEFGGFFNSVNGDRKYKSEDFANYFKSIIGTGINPSKDALRVTKKSNNQVAIMTGSACINGYLYLNSTEAIKSIATNVTRIDRVVLGLDIINRTLGIYVIQGTASDPPVLTRNSAKHELSLAKVIIKGSTVSIEDERGQKELCGYMDFLGKDDLQSMWDLFNTQWTDHKDLWKDWFVNMQGKSIRGIYIQNTIPLESKVGDIWIEIL